MTRLTPSELRTRKNSEPVAVLTCYTAPMAALLDPHVDVLLVGDSVGTVYYGMENTLGVTLEMMAAHAQAVVRGSQKACILVDLPAGTYETSPAQALTSAQRLLQTGAQAVKLEGGVEMAETIEHLTTNNIPVIGHVGLMPQHVLRMGGYKVQGRNAEEAARVMKDAKAVEAAGASAVVLEGVQEDVARDVTRALRIPTIGIGASPACDGQVLVVDDMLGITEKVPRFVKRYADLRGSVEQAVKQYAADVRSRTFPGAEHIYPPK